MILHRSCILTTALAFSLAASAMAGDKSTPAPEPPPVQNSWFADNVQRPKAPFEEVPGKDPNGWSFRLEPYLWSPGVYGTVGIGDLPQMGVNSSPIDVLKQLDWGVFMQAEIRKGRWGIAADGFFAQFSADLTPSGPIYKSASAQLQQSMDSFILAYRAIDARNFFVDAYAGARVYYMGLDITAEVKDTRATRLAQAIGERVAPEKAFPTSADADRWWADPILGLRFRVNVTRVLFLTGQADVGGFGAGSDIAFFTQGSAGVNITRNISLEAGYRYMYVDYNKDNFLFRMNMPGVYAGMGFRF
jgi:hypothetical protein